MVSVGRERHRESGLARYVLTESLELRVEGRLAAAETDAEGTVRIEFSQPLGDDVELKLVARLRRIAMSALQIAAIRKCYGNLPRSSRMERRGNANLVEEDV
jgi:hypothetical protein